MGLETSVVPHKHQQLFFCRKKAQVISVNGYRDRINIVHTSTQMNGQHSIIMHVFKWYLMQLVNLGFTNDFHFIQGLH
jgi:hypothetical protein